MVRCWAENPQDRLEFSAIVTELTQLQKSLQEGETLFEEDDEEESEQDDAGDD